MLILAGTESSHFRSSSFSVLPSRYSRLVECWYLSKNEKGTNFQIKFPRHPATVWARSPSRRWTQCRAPSRSSTSPATTSGQFQTHNWTRWVISKELNWRYASGCDICIFNVSNLQIQLLVVLDLSSNDITTIDREAFCCVPNLQKLDLSSNPLLHLVSHWMELGFKFQTDLRPWSFLYNL